MNYHPLAWQDARLIVKKEIVAGETSLVYTMEYPEVVPARKVHDRRPACLIVKGVVCDTTLEWKAVLAHDSLEFAEKTELYRKLVQSGRVDSATAVLGPVDVPIRSVHRLRSGVAYSKEWKEKFGVDPWRGHRPMRKISPKAGRFFLTIETDRFLEEGGYTVIFAMDREEIESGKAEAYADKFIAGIMNIEELWEEINGKWRPRYKMTVIRGRLRKGTPRVQYSPPILPERRGSKNGP